MGKKNRKDKNNKTHSKAEFERIVCSACGICIGKKKADFCYDLIYKNMRNNKQFIYMCLPALIRLKRAMKRSGTESTNILPNDVHSIFCYSGAVCENAQHKDIYCHFLNACYTVFRSQVSENGNFEICSQKKRKSQCICPPHPTFFHNSSEDDGWLLILKGLTTDDIGDSKSNTNSETGD